jgi:hypothetical protein
MCRVVPSAHARPRQAALMPMELKARGEVAYSLNGVEIANPTGRANL